MIGRPRLTRAALAALVLCCAAGGCGAKQPSGPADGGPGTGGTDAGADRGGDGPADGAFWTASVPLRLADQLFVLGNDWWALQGELGYQQWTRDTGASYQQITSGFIADPVLDQTFFMLGQSVDGTFLARWTRPDCVNLTNCFPPSAPGVTGDSFLIRYDVAAGAWQVVDQFPTGAPLPTSMTAAAGSLWLYQPNGIWRFDSPGHWSTVAAPADVTVIVGLHAGADGTLYLAGKSTGNQALVYQQPVGGTWTALPPAPDQIIVADLLIDGSSRVYLRADNSLSNRSPTQPKGCLFRLDGQQWTDVSPPFPAFGAVFPAADDLERGRCVAAVSPPGTLAVASQIIDGTSSQRSTIFLFISRDQGGSWIDRGAGLKNYFPEDVQFDPDGRVYVDGRIGSTIVWRSPTPDRW